MNKKALLLIFALPALVLLFLICYRRGHSVIGGPNGLMPSGVLRLSGDLSRKTYDTWTNRAFITVKDNDKAFSAVETLAASLPVSEEAKKSAIKSCVGIIKAYGRGDWEAFLSSRVPFPDFEINPQAIVALNRTAQHRNVANDAKITTANVLDIYHLVWPGLVNTNGLFSEISFVTNSIDVIESSPSYLAQIAPPSFADRANQACILYNPRSILDYSAKHSAQKLQKVKALRLFFMAKHETECNFYLFIFVLDEQNEVWFPYHLSIGYIGPMKHRLDVF